MDNTLIYTLNMEDKIIKVKANNVATLSTLLQKVSPETINNVINSTVEIIKATVILKANEQQFLYELEKLRTTSDEKVNIVNYLVDLIVNANLSQQNQDKIIDIICQTLTK